MAEIDQLKQGAEILQQVDVTEIITSLALGIAQAQEKLDNNSIKQALALADPNNGIGGKSLIELGFAPTFYHFQYADVSADISLKMRLQTEFELDASLSFNYTQQGGYSAEKLDFLQEDKNSKSRSEYKSTRAFVTHADNYESLTIETTEVKMKEEIGVVHRIDDFQQQILDVSSIDRANVEIDSSQYLATEITSDAGIHVINSGGFIVITVPPTASSEGVLRIGNYTPVANTPVDINGSGADLNIGDSSFDTFSEVMAGANTTMGGGTLIGFDAGANIFQVGTGAGVAIEVFFEFDKRDAKIAMTKPANAGVIPALKALAKVLENDAGCKVKVLGYTDGSGKSGYNDVLSEDRANSVVDYIRTFSANIQSNQFIPEGKGEELATAASNPNPHAPFRKVKIEFVTSGVDYIYFSGGSFVSTASPTTGTENYFIYTAAAGLPYTSPFAISFKSGGSVYFNSSTFADMAALETYALTLDKFSHQIIDNSMYLMHNESSIKYTTYTDQKENTSYATGSNESEDFSDTESRYLVDENSNISTRIKKDSETRKNPSTIAVGASVDLRVARQFEMSVSGNSRVAARLVSLPAPPEFLDELKNYYNA